MSQKKEYRSAVRSRKMIREAFESLLQEKPFEKITVTDIVNRANINRSTFYAHYPDVRGLMDDIMTKAIDASIRLVENTSITDILSDPTEFLAGLSALGRDNIELYTLIGKSEFALKQVEKLKTLLLDRALTTVDIPSHIRESTAFRIQLHFFIGGILNIYQQRVSGTLNCTDDEIMEQIGNLIRTSAELYGSWK